ncbi:MAG: DNA polymerase IV, partial [Hungatella sp.]
MKPSRIIFHIDVNSAFLSWESVYRLEQDPQAPDLRLIPSIVGGDRTSRHGVVLAKSTQAKARGIVTGEPIAQALKKCPELTIV